MVYQARPGFKGQAVVEVYGEYAEAWINERAGRGGAGPVGPGFRSAPADWVLLGAQRADMLQNDTDVFTVGRRLGQFRQVKLKALKHAVQINRMRIIYGNGEAEDVPVVRELRGGQESPAIDLKGRERFIEQIELSYKTKLNIGGDAIVEVYGLH